MSKRLEAALRLRDAALNKLRSEGSLEDTKSGPYLRWAGKDLEIGVWYPFQRLPPVSQTVKYFAVKPGKGPVNLNYGLDIWDKRGKVLNIEWSDTGEVLIVSFRRGDWEQKLLSLD